MRSIDFHSLLFSHPFDALVCLPSLQVPIPPCLSPPLPLPPPSPASHPAPLCSDLIALPPFPADFNIAGLPLSALMLSNCRPAKDIANAPALLCVVPARCLGVALGGR